MGGVAPLEVDRLAAVAEQARGHVAAASAAYQRWRRRRQEDLAQLELKLQQARLAVRQAERALERTRILAPFAG